MRIEDITTREVLTLSLQKTIEVVIKTKNGVVHSTAPINKNGIYTIRSLPVEEMIKRFLEIKRHFVNQTFDSLEEVDNFLHDIDISVDFRQIGGNLAFAVSSAFLKSFAQREDVKVHEYLSKSKSEIPVPLCTVAGKEKNQLDFKEFLLYPYQQKIFSKSIMKIANVCNELELDANVTLDKTLKKLSNITTKNALQIGVNLSASNLWNGRRYTYSTGENLTSQEQLMLIQDIITNYPVVYIEDPFHADDFVLFSTLTHRLPTRLVVGNEIYSNNLERFKRGLEIKATNAVNVAPDQMGTVTDIMTLVKEAKKNKIATVISADIDDSLISGLAVGLKFDYIKLGTELTSVRRMNELIRIENKM